VARNDLLCVRVCWINAMGDHQMDAHIRLQEQDYFMGIAQAVARRSPCLHRQVGCVLLDKHKHILSTGYNGPASGIDHCRVCHRKEVGRDLYACNAVHAEMNALLQCPDVQGIVTAYVTINPCAICARLLANTSAKLVVYAEEYSPESVSDFVRFWSVRLQRNIKYLRGIQG
jgi:dCMP deaminase